MEIEQTKIRMREFVEKHPTGNEEIERMFVYEYDLLLYFYRKHYDNESARTEYKYRLIELVEFAVLSGIIDDRSRAFKIARRDLQYEEE